MIDLETMCTEANTRIRQSIARSAGQHLRHLRSLARLAQKGLVVLGDFQVFKGANA